MLSSWVVRRGEKRHAGRYWRFVQVVRRPGRRRLQKHDDRRPDPEHRSKCTRKCQEGFQLRFAQGGNKEEGSIDRGSTRERLDRIKVKFHVGLQGNATTDDDGGAGCCWQ